MSPLRSSQFLLRGGQTRDGVLRPRACGDDDRVLDAQPGEGGAPAGELPVRRWREPDNRRVQRTALTPAGEELFERLWRVASRHDQRLRSRLTEEETALLGKLLDKLRAGLQE
jgi:hypothetical protein